MPVLRELAKEITEAVGIRELAVEAHSRSSANMTMLLRGDGQAFFAKIFTKGDFSKIDANVRYDREKQILSKTWPVGMPKLVYSADVPRVLVTREVRGWGFKHFMDNGETLDALGKIARWIAGFHASGETQPMGGSLWDEFTKYPEFNEAMGFDELRPLLEASSLSEYVLSKGDCSAANFKFSDKGVVGLDFEGVAFRAREYDLIGLLQGLHGLTGESIEDMVDTVVKQYASVRPIEDQHATKEVIQRLVEITDY